MIHKIMIVAYQLAHLAHVSFFPRINCVKYFLIFVTMTWRSVDKFWAC